jgi:excisionase family DNA binding protein
MSAYATSRLGLAAQGKLIADDARGSLLDALLDQIADRVAARLAGSVPQHSSDPQDDEWLDSRHAADYLGMHRDTLRRLAAERTIPSEQDGPNCKLYFRRSALDAWRRSGGRPRHLTTSLQLAA